MSVLHSAKVAKTLVNKGFWQVLHLRDENTVEERIKLNL